MKRLKDANGCVHFNGNGGQTLCGIPSFSKDMFDKSEPTMADCAEPVTCHFCSNLYCLVKNASWNEVRDVVLMEGAYSAMKDA